MQLESIYQGIWLGLMLMLLAIEGLTLSLTTLWFALGSLIAWVAAALGLPLWAQVFTFLLVSSVSLYYTRPIAMKYLKIGTQKTNVDLLIGELGIVTEDIVPIQSSGQVKVKGQVWSAKTDNNISILSGENIQIIRVEGVKLVVRKVEEN